MVPLFDLVASFVIVLVAGFLVGFFTVRANYVLMILLGYVFSSGTASGRYAAAGLIATLLVFLILGVRDPGFELGQFLLAGAFLGAFLLGVGISVMTLAEGRRAISTALDTIFPGRMDLPLASAISSVRTAYRLIESMPASARKAVELFSAIFNSRTFVFLVSLRNGRLRGRRFVNLSYAERREYLDDWRRAPGLSYGAHILRILAVYSYYVKDAASSKVDYDGELLRRSYLE